MAGENRFPFQSLDVYVAARELAARVHASRISDEELRDQATRAAKSCFLNLAVASRCRRTRPACAAAPSPSPTAAFTRPSPPWTSPPASAP